MPPMVAALTKPRSTRIWPKNAWVRLWTSNACCSCCSVMMPLYTRRSPRRVGGRVRTLVFASGGSNTLIITKNTPHLTPRGEHDYTRAAFLALHLFDNETTVAY